MSIISALKLGVRALCDARVAVCLLSGSEVLDCDEIAARLAAIRQDWEAGRKHGDQEVERLHGKELEQEREAEVRRERGPGREL